MRFLGLIMGGLGAVGLLTGCAPSAQNVKLTPAVEVEERFVGSNPQLALRVVDRRPKGILGYRNRDKGIILGIEGELADEVREGLLAAFEGQGIEVKDWDGEADNRLTVDIDSFDYGHTGGFLRRQVELSTEWDIRGSFEGEQVSFQARARSTEWSPFAAGEEKNEELVNSILNRMIHKVVTNNDLFEQLRD